MSVPPSKAVHATIVHPLSAHYVSGYQDLWGCSRNGYRWFLFEAGIIESEEELHEMIASNLDHMTRIIVDHRGCVVGINPIEVRDYKCLELMLRMKNTYINLEGGYSTKKPIKTQVGEPIDQEDTFSLIGIYRFVKTSASNWILGGGSQRDESVKYWRGVSKIGGKVVGLSLSHLLFFLENELMDQFSSLNHLRYLKLDIGEGGVGELNDGKFDHLFQLSSLCSLKITFRQIFDTTFLDQLSVLKELRELDLNNNCTMGGF